MEVKKQSSFYREYSDNIDSCKRRVITNTELLIKRLEELDEKIVNFEHLNNELKTIENNKTK
ncbi:MAG: hypothetical protein NZZ41_07955 [Candidatus Dojkabacteria bacterium]|nr:hypothetical protein [Candidatus Dojkabacteria bacterium]